MQREVLKLYRAFLVACRGKPKETKLIVQSEFRRYAGIEKTNTVMIDYLLRRGKRQLKTLQQSDKITII